MYRKSFAYGILLFVTIMMMSTNAAYLATSRPEVQDYIQHLADKYQFDEEKLQRLFQTVTFNEEVIRKIQKPAESKPWYLYKRILITEDRINKGVAYWRQHESVLSLAEKKYGVPASIIVAIIGVETKYGENKGTFPVFNTLVTLAFNHGQRREGFFRSELTEYLLLARENKLAPLLLKGSYAGAIGLPQFMPSSYRHYAVDSQHKGFADLIQNHADAIFSVGNYLSRHGWKAGEPIAITAKVQGDDLPLLQKKFKPSLTLADLTQHNIEPEKPIKTKFCFFRLQNEQGYEYWLGLKNFHVITTYNSSELYAMAVRGLAKKIEEVKNNHPQAIALESPGECYIDDEDETSL